MNRKIGKITNKVIDILNLNYSEEKLIFIGTANINHIKEEHPNDYLKYGCEICDIINNPTYLARKEKKKSIEFIKEYKVENEYILVVVRVSNNNVHFVRTMYVMSEEKVKNINNTTIFINFNLKSK